MSQEQLIQDTLQGYGFTVEKIPEREGVKTPDFYVTKDGDEYTIELKTKYMNKEIINDMQDAFNDGKMHTNVVPLSSTNKQKKIIHSAKEQLKAEPIYEDSFNIAWFHCEGHDASTTMELFENALYGKACVIDWKDGTNKAYDCYYYHSNAMFNQYKDILDGAVITTSEDKIKVLLNLYSSKYEELKKSSLCLEFEGGVQDPIEREREGYGVFVDEDMDREDIHESIKKKYGFKTLKVMPLRSYTITAALQK